MKHIAGWLLVVWCLVFVPVPRAAYAANAAVGNGTPASCTEAAFDNALATAQADQGGSITFNCGPNNHTIDIYTSAVIFEHVSINGGGKIQLAAQGVAPFFNRPRFFEVATGGWLMLQDITLEGGRSPAGDGWGAQGGSIVVWGGGNPEDRTGLELYNVAIRNSASTAWGGAIANEGGEVRIVNSRIVGSSARWGGAYNGANGSDIFLNTSIEQSTSQQGGGGLRFWNSLDSQVIDSTVVGNSTAGAGGGIENIGGNVTVQSSYVEQNSAGTWGGGLKNSYNTATSTQGRLTVTRSSIADNQATENGGGVDSNDRLIVQDSTLRQNNARRGGGLINWGGQLTLSGVTFDRNTADNGGAIFQHAGGSTITGVTLSGNSATQNGGGLYLERILGANAANWAKISASRLIGNSAGFAGGAIVASSAYLTVDSSEFANNSGTTIHLARHSAESVGSYLALTTSSIHDNPGGGVSNAMQSTLLIANTTISQNGGWGVFTGSDSIVTSLGFATLRGNTSGQLRRSGGQLELKNSVLDSGGVTAANCLITAGLPAPDISGTWSSDGSCGAGPVVSSNLHLGPLALNGGTTPNHMPQSNSAVINQVGCGNVKQDQRAAVRPASGSTFCDAGAIEYGATLLAQRMFLPILVR